MVEGFFESIGDLETDRAGGRSGEAGEITHRLRGSIRPKEGERGPVADEEDYRRHLGHKHS